MKKFIFKIFYNLFLVFIFHLCFSFFIYFSELGINDNTSHFISEQKAGVNHNLIIGDSRSLAGIDPIQISQNYLSISLPGSTFVEGYAMLNRVLQESQVDTVILCYGQSHFERSDYFESLIKSCRIIYNFKTLLELNKLEEKTNSNYTLKNGTLKLYDKIRRFLIYFCIIERETSFGKVVYNTIHQNKIKSKLLKQKGHILLGQNDSTAIANEESKEIDFLTHPIIETYFYKIDQLCKQKKIVVFFISPPVSKISYNSNLNYYIGYKSKIQEFKNNSNVIFLNSVDVYDNKCFGDNSHLNKYGCDKFTNDIKLFITCKL